MKNKLTPAAKKAFVIGGVSVATYVFNYVLRNMLSVLTPFMLREDAAAYTVEYIALLSSLYMALYATGQLFNGVLGDRFSPKTMVLLGLLSGGTVSAAFPFLPHGVLQMLCFAVLGYGLSMVRGPLMKIISENTAARHAQRICMCFSSASFAGPLVAGVFATVLQWRWAFVVAGGITAAVGVVSFAVLSVLEKRGQIAYKSIKGGGFKEIFSVFRIENFAFFLVVACLVEITGMALSFWIPTLLNEYAGYTEKQASALYTLVSFCRALVPFTALGVLRLFGGKERRMMRVAYIVTLFLFVGMLVIPTGGVTVALLIGALMANSLVAALLWSIYIPGLGATGRVSSINGILDCAGYLAASAATSLFGAVVVHFGYRGLIVSFVVIPVLGIATSFMKTKKSA